MDGSQYQAEEIARDRDLGELEDDRAGVADDASTDLDQPRLQARRSARPSYYLPSGAPAIGPSIHKPRQHISEVSLRIEAIQLAGLHQRGYRRPLCASIIA